MHVADPLSRRSNHYVHSSEDNKEQVLLQPESVNKIVDASEKSHEDRQSVKTGSSQSGPDKGGKCNSVGLSAACPSKVAMIRSVVVVVM